tara:strand:- start:3179 stop:3817 length:639 start_codon:yes stop_codon:yes gene_type:complete
MREPWSHLHIDVIEPAMDSMADNVSNGVRYHDAGHINYMFEYLQETNTPYSLELDLAIWYHDTIYDRDPDKESRSASFMCEQLADYYHPSIMSAAGKLIMATVDHKIGKRSEYSYEGPVRNAIIRADLAALRASNSDLIITNTIKLLDEAIALYTDLTSDTIIDNSVNFLANTLWPTVVQNALDDPEHVRFWNDVGLGIHVAIGSLKTLKIS